jgi:hypothetical protein
MRRFPALLVLIAAWLYSTLPTGAQDTTTSLQTWTAEGLLSTASRSFQAGDEQDGTFYLNVEAFEFDTALRAENGIDPLVDSLLKYMSPYESFARPVLPTVPPTIGDSTLAYEGQVILEGGYTFDTAILIMRHGRYLHPWFALARGFAANPLLDLATIADQFFPDPYDVSTTPEPARLLDNLPSLIDLPTGFALTKESG